MGSIMLKVHSNITVCLLVSEVIRAAITYPWATTWIFLNPWLLLESGADIAAALWHHHVWVLAAGADLVRCLVPPLHERAHLRWLVVQI